jgi:YD repeat-containing protein
MCPVLTPAWTQSFSYDGFGNLTSKTLNGTTTGIPVDSVSNRLKSDGVALSNVNYDSNGNLTSVTNLSAPSA